MNAAVVGAHEERNAHPFVCDLTARLRGGAVLSEDDAARMMRLLLAEQVGVDTVVEYLALLAARGPAPSEVVGSALALRDATTPLHTGIEALDNCGTGGDRTNTFNVSTVAALAAAAAGQSIVKHGNRSSSGGVGSADFVEAVGLPLDLHEDALRDSLHHHRFAFLFAPRFRPAAGRIREARRRIPGPTLFNFMGPLCNPARPAFQIIGTFSETAARTLAEAVARLGTRRTIIITGPGGIDELLPQDGNFTLDVSGCSIRENVIDARDSGLIPCSIGDLRGGSALDNARMAAEIFSGARGAPREAVVLNAGLVLLAAGRADSLRDGCAQAATAIDRGAARALLHRLKADVRTSGADG